ncbi:MAG: hypothetical protein AB8B83_00970 [Bdellovibrionales bacterium]
MTESESNIAYIDRGILKNWKPPQIPLLRNDFHASVMMERRDPNKAFHLLFALDARNTPDAFAQAVEVAQWKMRFLQEEIAKSTNNRPLIVTWAINDGEQILLSEPTENLMGLGDSIKAHNVNAVGSSGVARLLRKAKVDNQEQGYPDFDAAIISLDHLDMVRPQGVLETNVDTQEKLVEAAKRFGAPIFPMLQIAAKGEYQEEINALKKMMDESGAHGWPMHFNRNIKFKDRVPQQEVRGVAPSSGDFGISPKAMIITTLIGVGIFALFSWLEGEEPVVEVEPEQIVPLYTFSGDDPSFQFNSRSADLSEAFEAGLDVNVIQPLLENPRDLVFEGHASPDDALINMRLSGERALSVSNYVAGKINLDIDMTEVRCGQSQPLFEGDGSFDMQGSQRVSVHYADQYVLPEGCGFLDPELAR